jgi:hypothetical protein
VEKGISYVCRDDEPVLDTKSSRQVAPDIYTQGDGQGGQDHHGNAESIQIGAAGAFEGTELKSVITIILV